VHTVVKGAVGLRAADPGQPGVVQMTVHLIHLYALVSFIHVAYVKVDQIAEALPHRGRQIGRPQPCIVDHHVVLERLGQIVIARLGEVQDGLLALLRRE